MPIPISLPSGDVLDIDTFLVLRDVVVRLDSEQLPDVTKLRAFQRAYRSGYAARGQQPPELSDAQLSSFMRCVRLSSFFARHSTSNVIQAALAAEKLSCTAAPQPKCCLVCQGELSGLEPHPKAKPVFYPHQQPGQSGCAFIKRCSACNLVYTVSGYESADTFGRAEGARHHYPAVFNHPRWFQSTRDTYIDVKSFELLESMLHYNQSGFEGVCNVVNDMAHKAGASAGDRSKLVPRRLQEATMRWWARDIVQSLAPAEDRELFNMKLKLDDQLEQVSDVLRDHLRDLTHDHHVNSKKHSLCGALTVIDGHSKVARRRCSCIVELQPALQQVLASPEAKSLSRYCSNTPVRNDRLGRCASCIALAGGRVTDDQEEAAEEDDDVVAPDNDPIFTRTRARRAAAAAPAATAAVATAAVPSATAAGGGALELGWALAEAIVDEKYNTKKGRVEYKIKWLGLNHRFNSWRSGDEVSEALLSAWVDKNKGIRLKFQELTPEERAELVKDKPVILTPEEQATYDKRVQPGGIANCGLRQPEGKFAHATGGALFAFCACGQMLPPMELPAAESCSMVLLYILDLFKNSPFNARGGKAFLAYDDMCHLRRFIEARKEWHPRLPELLDAFTTVVDKFHFIHNHRGKYCHRHTNPLHVPELAGANLSVAEQRFKEVARHRWHMNTMNRTRFNFMLLKLCQLDFRYRA